MSEPDPTPTTSDPSERHHPTRGLVPLLIGTAALFMGNGLQNVLLPQAAVARGFAELATGAMGAAYFAGFLLGCLATGVAVQRVGHIRVFAALSALVCAAALGYQLFTHPAAWIPLRLVTGLCIAGLFIVIESWINATASDATRGRVFARYRMVDLGSVIAGQMLLNLPAPLGFELFSTVAALVALGVLPVALAAPAAPPVPRVRIDLTGMWRTSPLALAAIFATGLANGPIWSLGPVFTGGLGLSVFETSLFMAAIVVGGAALQYPVGAVSDRVDRRHVILGQSAIATLVSLTCANLATASLATEGGLPLLLTLAALWGGFAFPLYSLGIAYANDRRGGTSGGGGDFVGIAGTLLLSYAFGAVFAPLPVSALMGSTGPSALFWWCGGVHGALALFCAWRMWVRAPVPPTERGSFVALTPTRPNAFPPELAREP